MPLQHTLKGSLVVAALAGVPRLACAQLSVQSADGRNVATVAVRNGQATYTLARDGRTVLLPSRLGIAFRGAPALGDSLKITGSSRDSADETWTQPWGEVARVRDHHNELRVKFSETTSTARSFDVVFRVFNDGIGFRYDVPAQPNLGAFQIEDELTEFALADDAKAWWIPSNRPRLDRSEMLYSSSPVSIIDSVQTPLTMKTSWGTYAVIHEADLVDYARMNIAGHRMENRSLRVALAPMHDGVKVRGQTP